MKTKAFSKNRITSSHPVRSSELAPPCNRLDAGVVANSSVSNRDKIAILRQAQEIRDSWTNDERDQRAQMGAQRRAELCQLLFGAN